jgi:DNA repair protein RadC
MLDSKNGLIGVNLVSQGSLSMSAVCPREVFKAAILANSAAVIFLHNHPSGCPEPSLEDRNRTSRLCEAGKILGIRVLDHVVVGQEAFFSFADCGLLAC